MIVLRLSGTSRSEAPLATTCLPQSFEGVPLRLIACLLDTAVADDDELSDVLRRVPSACRDYRVHRGQGLLSRFKFGNRLFHFPTCASRVRGTASSSKTSSSTRMKKAVAR